MDIGTEPIAHERKREELKGCAFSIPSIKNKRNYFYEVKCLVYLFDSYF